MFLRSICFFSYFVFFFKQKTAYEMRISDWSSDVCSSDLRRLTRRSLTQARGKDAAHKNLFNRLPIHTSALDRRPDRARAKLCGLQPGQIPLKPTYRSPGIAGDDDGIFCHGNPCFSSHNPVTQQSRTVGTSGLCSVATMSHHHNAP